MVIHVIVDVCTAKVKKIRDLVVFLRFAAGGGNDDEASGGVGLNDGPHLAELFGTGAAAAAEFRDLKHGSFLCGTDEVSGRGVVFYDE